MIKKFLDYFPGGLNWSPSILYIKREENLNTLSLNDIYIKLKSHERYIYDYKVSSTSNEKVYHLTNIKESSPSLAFEMPNSIPLKVRQSICSNACIVTLNRYSDHNHCLIKDMENVRKVNNQLREEESVYKTKI